MSSLPDGLDVAKEVAPTIQGPISTQQGEPAWNNEGSVNITTTDLTAGIESPVKSVSLLPADVSLSQPNEAVTEATQTPRIEREDVKHHPENATNFHP
ncbi:hypothetical protein MRX96_015117 [Rhipicephalus microplus]